MKKVLIQEGLNIEINYSKPSKEEIVLDWLLRFRNYLLQNKIANFGDIIPSKKDISKLLKISTGTVQNAIKYAEDLGYFVSKQCVGTKISDPSIKNELKMVSKKDKAVFEIKKFLINEKYEENEIIPNIIDIAGEIKTSANTARIALYKLVQDGILRKEIKGTKTVFIINSKIENEKTNSPFIKNKNLAKIIKENIKKYLLQNYKAGDKIPPNAEFAKMFNVSIRTINSAMKELNKEKFILSRRGKYGSIFTDENDKSFEKSMFMSIPKNKNDIEKNYDYKWEVALEKIKKYILKNHEAGDKILSIKEFANRLNISTTTVKRAIKELKLQGILFAQKGKYGGLFVNEMPEHEGSYQWLAINSELF